MDGVGIVLVEFLSVCLSVCQSVSRFTQKVVGEVFFGLMFSPDYSNAVETVVRDVT